MKNFLLFFAFFICCNKYILSQTIIYDDFDDYKAGEYLGIESNGLWTTWNSQPASTEDVVVSESNSYSPDNSINLISDGVVDVVLPLGDQNSGKWNLSFMMQIENGYGAYFNILHDFAAAASNWGLQVYFNSSGSGYLTVGSGLTDQGTTFTHLVGSWFEVKITIDVDADVAEIYFDNVAIYSWMWSEGSVVNSPIISALNLYPNGQDNEQDSYFVDNVSFAEYDLSIEKIEKIGVCYPNPTSNSFFINHQANSQIEVVNILGETVYKNYSMNKSTSVDCSTWKKGLYIVKFMSENSLNKKEFLLVF